MSACFLSAVITINEQDVPSCVAERIVVKFLTNENVKPAEILMRVGAQFGDEPLSRIQMYDLSKSFKEGRTEVESTRILRLLQGKLWPAVFGLSLRPFHRFSDRTTNHQRSLLFEAS
jgi:hypothetical protein